MALRDGLLLGMGNPLLDIAANVDDAFMEKYGLKPDNAILADEKHLPMYDEMKKMRGVEYTAGGATQNAIRICQWMIGKTRVTTFMGCVGQDDNAKILEDKLNAEGVRVLYQKTDQAPTGTCAVAVTSHGRQRSLCANLGAANCFTIDHIEKPENWSIVENSDFVYIAGFFLTVSLETIMKVSERVSASCKTFCMNLAAPFISEFFRDRLLAAFPRIDILFGNDLEYSAFAKNEGIEFGDDMVELGKKIAAYPKHNDCKKRLVIITQGPGPVICVQGDTVTTFNVPQLEAEEIVDTNGAGDAFVGGFLSQHIRGSDLRKCVDAGVWAAHQIIRRSGATFPPECDYKGSYLPEA